MKVALVTIATNKYVRYIGPLLDSAYEHFFVDDDVDAYVFTNRPDHIPTHHATVLSCPDWGFPEATLYRYRLIADNAGVFDADVIFWCDADMLFVGPVGHETVPDVTHGGLVAVRHPGFYKGGGSWETRRSSTAFTAHAAQRTYYAGGFYGGARYAFLDMAAELAHNIDVDEANHLCAVWHDESHLNQYLSTRSPLTLGPAYCYPEHLDLGPGVERRLLALFKDHAEARS